MAGGGIELLERAFLEHEGEDSKRRARVTSWDQSLVTLTVVPRCRIPPVIEEKWGLAVHRANCGLLALLRHAWVSVDSMLYIWDYCQEDSPVVPYTADSAIITVGVCRPKPGILPCESWLLLVVATRRTVSLIAIVPVPGQRPRIRFETDIRGMVTPRYVVPTDGAIFHSIRCNLAGNIFLLCGAPQVYELVYTAEPSWFRSNAQLVRHSVGWWPWFREFVSVAPQVFGRITHLECARHDYVVTVDDTSSIRLLRSFSDNDKVMLEELSVLTALRMDKSIAELMHLSLASCTVDHISLALGLDGHLHLHVVTTAGDRLHFICSSNSPQGPPCIGAVVPPCATLLPYTQTAAETDKQFFGFWLKEFVQGGSAASTPGSLFQSPIIRSACMELSSDPCICATGICLRASRQPSCATATNIEVSVCTEDRSNGAVGGARVELQHVLELSYPILDICADYDGISFEPALDRDVGAMYRDRAFAVLLQDGVKIIRISHQPWDFGRAPATPKECCSHLLQLDLIKSGRMRGMCEWMWSLDDAGRAPSFDVQQHHMCVAHTIPPMSLGRWFHGLLHCLAIILRPIWSARLVKVTAATSRPFWNFYKRRRVATYCFGFSDAAVENILAQLSLLLKFVAKGSGIRPLGMGRPLAPSTPSGVAARSRMYAKPKSDVSDVPVSVIQLLSDVLDVCGRLEQILGLLRVLRNYSSHVLQSSNLPADVLNALLQRPCSDFVASADGMQPFVHLCAAGISMVHAEDATQARTGVADMVRDLQEKCPLIFAQVDQYQCSSSRATSQPRSVEVGAAAVGEALWASSLDMTSAYWEPILRGIEEATPDVAQKMCVSKLEQLSEASGDSEAVATLAISLVSSLIKGLISRTREFVATSHTPLATVLARTHGLRFATSVGRDSTRSAATTLLEDARVAKLPVVHAAVLECLLAEAARATSLGGARTLLDGILASKCIDMEGFLIRRYTSDKMAAEYLARYYQESYPARTVDVLLLLSEWPDSSRLEERLRYLDLAKEHAKGVSEEAKEASAHIERRLQVARKIQVPLRSELYQIAGSTHLHCPVSTDARSRLEEIEQLLDLQALHDIALHFGLFHILLLIADSSEGAHAREDISAFWISLFCPPRSCAYHLPPSNFATEDVASLARKFFPLLTVRRGPFFAEEASRSPAAPLASLGVECLKSRSMALVQELAQCTRVRDPPSSLWDVRCIATVLEYSNCLWLAAMKAHDIEAECSHCRTWVALDVLHKEPFSAPLVEIVSFYKKMLDSSSSWLRELQAKLPERSDLMLLDEDDLQVHLSEVMLAVLGEWISEVTARTSKSRDDGQALGIDLALSEFREDWQKNGEGLLAGLSLRLNGLQYHHPSAKLLLQQVSGLETKVRRLLGYTRYHT